MWGGGYNTLVDPKCLNEIIFETKHFKFFELAAGNVL